MFYRIDQASESLNKSNNSDTRGSIYYISILLIGLPFFLYSNDSHRMSILRSILLTNESLNFIYIHSYTHSSPKKNSKSYIKKNNEGFNHTHSKRDDERQQFELFSPIII